MISTIERLTPIDFLSNNNIHSVELHKERYGMVQSIVQPNDVILDIACGIGYGAAIMLNNSPNISKIIGVDIDMESIAFAKDNYKNSKTDFIHSNISDFLIEECFDIIVSFETIEHLTNPNELLIKMESLLKPIGKIILSFPSSPSLDINKYHLSDIQLNDIKTFCDFHRLKITNIQHQIQTISLKTLFTSDLKRELSIKSLILFYYKNPIYIFKRIKHTIKNGLSNHYTILTIEKN